MNKARAFVFIVVALCSLVSSAQEEVFIDFGIGTGQDYADMNRAERDAYTVGLVNGIMIAPAFAVSKTRWIEPCLRRMTRVQIREILSKYIRENPEKWHEGLHINSLQALFVACPRP